MTIDMRRDAQIREHIRCLRERNSINGRPPRLGDPTHRLINETDLRCIEDLLDLEAGVEQGPPSRP